MDGGGFAGRRLAPVGLALAALALIGPTAGNAARVHPTMRVAQLESPPPTLAQGDAITVKGKVANRGKRARAAQVNATLSSAPEAVPPAAMEAPARLDRTFTATVRGGKQRRFRIDADVPTSLEPGTYYLVACVRRGGTQGRRACKSSGQAIEITAVDFTPGSRSLGDELFPQVGNGGYDALHYTIDLQYDPDDNRFEPGTSTTIRARATQDLSEFSLDFQNLEVTEVTVNGKRAEFEQIVAEPPVGSGTQPRKLVVKPARAIRNGREFQVRVEYEGVPDPIIDPDGSSEGWIRACSAGACDGAFVVNQPIGAQSWFPNNNHPTDKATFTTRIAVPEGKVAFGVGELVSSEPNGDGTITWEWEEDQPTATYLTTATNGDFHFIERTMTEAGTGRELPLLEGIDVGATQTQLDQLTTALDRTESMVNFLVEMFGPYPFDSAGAVVDRTTGVGYALEVQTKPHYATLSVSQGTQVHELGHQWFGNAVTLESWNDMWFQEGWAQWIGWKWAEFTGGQTTAQAFALNYASTSSPSRWDTIPTELNGDPAQIFAAFPNYTRGAMTYEGYRQIVGDEKFYEFARELVDRFAYDNVSTEDVVDLALEISGFAGERLELLEEYFQQWLYEAGKPEIVPSSFE